MGAPIRVVHETDPKDDIRRDVGHLCEGMTVMGADVLIVMYERVSGEAEKKTAGGLLVPITARTTAHEDKFQGKVGLVMKMGPLAFEDDDNHRWGGVRPQVGDWVLINVSETYSFDLPVYTAHAARTGSPDGERRCRLVQDVYVKLIVSEEMFDAIW